MQLFRNHILHTLPPADLQLLSSAFARTRLEPHKSFESVGAPVEQVCFPEAGIISVVARNKGGREIEAGLIGFEGMTGLSLLMGDGQSPHDAYVQLAGDGSTLTAAAFRSALRASSTLKDRLLRYAHTFMIQVAQTALANGRAKIDERLARWLLMADDRVDGSDLPLTHEFMAVMLGVRRPGVTDALHRLEGERLIRARRGMVTIRDRGGLERLAQKSYGVPEREYQRLFGESWRSTASPPPTPLMAAEADPNLAKAIAE